MAQWEAQPTAHRAPALPMIDDGKVNARALTLALGLQKSQEQHFRMRIAFLSTFCLSRTEEICPGREDAQ